MQTRYEVLVTDTIRGLSEIHTFTTIEAARAHYHRMQRQVRRNGHNAVELRVVTPDGRRYVYESEGVQP